MAKDLTVEINFDIKFRIEKTDPTGDTCTKCKEVPYLHAFYIRTFVNGRMIDERGPPIYLCESCKDVVRKEYKGLIDDSD